jgi:hypothetical protein
VVLPRAVQLSGVSKEMFGVLKVIFSSNAIADERLCIGELEVVLPSSASCLSIRTRRVGPWAQASVLFRLSGHAAAPSWVIGCTGAS